MKRIEELSILIDRIPFAEGNIGEEAILASLIQDLMEIGIRHIDVLSNQPDRTRMRHGSNVHVIAEKSSQWWALPVTIRRYDLLIWGGGHMLQDRSSQLYIPNVVKTLLLARIRNLPRFIYAPGLGPVEDPPGKLLSKLALPKSHAIVVRDEGSKRLLETIGISDAIHLTADPAFKFKTEFDDLVPKQHNDPPVIGIAPRRLFYRRGGMLPVKWQLSTGGTGSAQFDQFLAHLSSALDQLAKQRQALIKLIPMDIGPNPQDQMICKAIQDKIEHKQNVEIYDDDPTLSEFIHRLAGLDLLVSARLHGIILGLRYGLPFIGIDSDGKIPRLASLVDMEEYVIKDTEFDKDSFYTLAMNSLDNVDNIRTKLIDRNEKLTAKSKNTSHLLRKCLESIANT